METIMEPNTNTKILIPNRRKFNKEPLTKELKNAMEYIIGEGMRSLINEILEPSKQTTADECYINSHALDKENSELKNSISKLKEDHKKELSNLERNYDDNCVSFERTISQLEAKLMEKTNLCENYISDISDFINESNDLKDTIDMQVKLITENDKQIKEYESIKNDLQDKIDCLQEDVTKYSRHLIRLEHDNDYLTSKNKELTEQNDFKEKEYNKLIEKKFEIEEKYTKLLKEYQVLENQQNQQEVVEETEDEYFDIDIDGVTYCTNNIENGIIFEITKDGDIGEKVGYYENSEHIFY